MSANPLKVWLHARHVHQISSPLRIDCPSKSAPEQLHSSLHVLHSTHALDVQFGHRFLAAGLAKTLKVKSFAPTHPSP
jgi:hypothetical protein